MLLRKSDVKKHPILAVGICKNCRKHYLSGPFLKDEDGSDSECSWCGEGGEVVCCGQCDKVFCQACISRNFGGAEAGRIVSSDDWLCYVCNPVPLYVLTQQLRQSQLEAVDASNGDRLGAGDSIQDTMANMDQEAIFKQSKQGRHRKNIRKVLDDDELEEKQKELLAREKERQERLEEWRSAAGMKTIWNPTKRKAISTEVPWINMEDSKGLINVARAENEAAVRIAPSLASILKDHQTKRVRFMWENCIVSEQKVKEGAESFGCILAHSMGLGKTLQRVDFVREGFLGSPQVFKNRFQNPIENGQHADSTVRDVRLMKQRAHVLHEELKGCVQRMNTSVLKDELPSKCVYVISVRLSPLQRQLYTHYLQVHGLLQGVGEVMEDKSQRKYLFHAYHALAKVWNHPELLLAEEERTRKQEDCMGDLVVDSDEEKLSDVDIGADGVSSKDSSAWIYLYHAQYH